MKHVWCVSSLWTKHLAIKIIRMLNTYEMIKSHGIAAESCNEL